MASMAEGVGWSGRREITAVTFIQLGAVHTALAWALPHLTWKEPRVGFQHVAPKSAGLSVSWPHHLAL